MTREPRVRRARFGFAAIAMGSLLLPGCYSRVVDARGLGADSTELRESVERDARPPTRRMVRRSLLDEGDTQPPARED